MIPKEVEKVAIKNLGFRLLNSEIGNDRTQFVAIYLKGKCFRLLNSEIGNDQAFENTSVSIDVNVFVSLTRR